MAKSCSYCRYRRPPRRPPVQRTRASFRFTSAPPSQQQSSTSLCIAYCVLRARGSTTPSCVRSNSIQESIVPTRALAACCGVKGSARACVRCGGRGNGEALKATTACQTNVVVRLTCPAPSKAVHEEARSFLFRWIGCQAKRRWELLGGLGKLWGGTFLLCIQTPNPLRCPLLKFK